MSQEASAPRRDFFPVRTEKLLDNSLALFDIYFLPEATFENARDDDFVLYAKAPFRWTLRELTGLLRQGVAELYVREQQRPQFIRYSLAKTSPLPVDDALEARFRIRQAQNVAIHLLEAAVAPDLQGEELKGLHGAAAEIVACLQEDPSCIQELQALNCHSVNTYIHSMAVALLAPAIAMRMGESDRETLALLGVAGLLHDIGKQDVPLSILEKCGPLTPAEWAQVKGHPLRGLERVSASEVPPLVTQVIEFHHERLDGTGYPHGLRGQAIPIWAQIVAVADVFSAMTSSRSYHFRRSRFEALTFMKHELRESLSREAFRALVECLSLVGK